MNDGFGIFSRKRNTLATEETLPRIMLHGSDHSTISKRHPSGRKRKKSVLETSVRIFLPMICTLGRSFLPMIGILGREKKG